MADRLRCIVPFCRRTRGGRAGDPIADISEWICGEHWRLVDKEFRRVYARARRADRRRGEHSMATHRLWRRCKTAAIEAAGGLR